MKHSNNLKTVHIAENFNLKFLTLKGITAEAETILNIRSIKFDMNLHNEITIFNISLHEIPFYLQLINNTTF